MLSEIIGQDHEEFVANNLHTIREKTLNGPLSQKAIYDISCQKIRRIIQDKLNDTIGKSIPDEQ
ncbi:MAG: hypothetical protein M9898_11055 [Chitinophagaceae bacterium]|nr:hypothetical protein [Chitinophagaceae bacterium]